MSDFETAQKHFRDGGTNRGDTSVTLAKIILTIWPYATALVIAPSVLIVVKEGRGK